MRHIINLLPLGREIVIEDGKSLRDALFAHGVEFPCGGRGLCKGCKVKVLQGTVPVSTEDRQKLSRAEMDAGWRLACRAQLVEERLTLELAQWEAPILTDSSTFDFTPAEGLGAAVDLGTTTLVVQLTDLSNGNVLGVRTGLNAQASHGADIMSRVEFAVASGPSNPLTAIIRRQIGGMIRDLLADTGRSGRDLRRVTIVGNTVMHHLFCGLSVEPLSHYPFEPAHPGEMRFTSAQLDWNLDANPEVVFLPCLGGFVGSDILAGILATRLHQSDATVALIDLGTNGEIVVGNRHRMLCTSTAAGPAFEGATISMGMRAATGAISEVRVSDGQLDCNVLGDAEPRGICGSGLVDAAACALDLNWMNPRGRITLPGAALKLAGAVSLNQWDIRELQLAKGAIAAGLRLLLRAWGTTSAELSTLFLAGAFGNYINYASAHRIGLLQVPASKVQPAGNTALLGAKLALFDPPESQDSYRGLLAKVRHLSLKEDPQFQEAYVEEMGFPTP